MKLIEHLAGAVRSAADYNSAVEVAPLCVLWPDGARQWEPLLPDLLASMPELLVLGPYAPERRQGPALWVRMLLEGYRREGCYEPGEFTPVIYLPGWSMRQLHPDDHCPWEVKLLAMYQYGGTVWQQEGDYDWSIADFLRKRPPLGLGLDVAGDEATERALGRSLGVLMAQDFKLWQGRRLDATTLNKLMAGDPVRDLLLWLSDGDSFRNGRSKESWQTFVDIMRSDWQFDPEREGLLTGAERLARREGSWLQVWERFCEAPQLYPGLPDVLRRCPVPPVDVFCPLDAREGWPQWNEQQEAELLEQLRTAAKLPTAEARKRVLALEVDHGFRRSWVWARLGQSSLALALEHLAELARRTQEALAGGSLADVASRYEAGGWRADWAVLQALAAVRMPEAERVVGELACCLYVEWADAGARYIQAQIEGQASRYPASSPAALGDFESRDGLCVLFVDGLRYDLGAVLAGRLRAKGREVSSRAVWSALPSVTATAKPAVSPVRSLLSGLEVAQDFEPSVAEEGQSLRGGYHFRKLLESSGWQFLEALDTGTGTGRAWTEQTFVDQAGHERGWRLAQEVDALLDRIARQVVELLDLGGWKRVRVVSDHGWLLLPGGLPKVELPAGLAENKWGRCAVLKSGSDSPARLFPWFWNADQEVALAEGIYCYKAGQEYSHGGLSVQECLTLELEVWGGGASETSVVQLEKVSWRRLRCTVEASGSAAGLRLDVRLEAGDAATSLVQQIKPLNEDGLGAVLVSDEDYEGREAFVVLLDTDERAVAQERTRIGMD
jgi:hypothetical protein